MTTLATRPVGAHLARCSHCPGVVAVDGQPVHDHHPSCTYWSLRCRICQVALNDHDGQPAHPDRAELCFMCGDLIEVDSHP